MMSLWDALRMNMMISYQELVRTFPKKNLGEYYLNAPIKVRNRLVYGALPLKTPG